ncbi:hypothetical protein HPB51_011473 [Rhipicephalus microplus]|uniref:Uncharacterized protein n=1 Tax=Rhipicephalus microplus TaxID=6941 RepID=A0A9J6E0Z1_RHIMP|nr:hypothetical protein HPB51_011473 [Rhipicephalus microplus]
MQVTASPVEQLSIAEMVRAELRQAVHAPQPSEAPQQRHSVEMSYAEAVRRPPLCSSTSVFYPNERHAQQMEVVLPNITSAASIGRLPSAAVLTHEPQPKIMCPDFECPSELGCRVVRERYTGCLHCDCSHVNSATADSDQQNRKPLIVDELLECPRLRCPTEHGCYVLQRRGKCPYCKCELARVYNFGKAHDTTSA